MKNFNFNRAWESYVSSEISLIQKCVFNNNTHTHNSKGFLVLYIYIYEIWSQIRWELRLSLHVLFYSFSSFSFGKTHGSSWFYLLSFQTLLIDGFTIEKIMLLTFSWKWQNELASSFVIGFLKIILKNVKGSSIKSQIFMPIFHYLILTLKIYIQPYSIEYGWPIWDCWPQSWQAVGRVSVNRSFFF